MRIALVHDWLTGMRGGEKVLSQMCQLFPQGDLLTLLHVPGSCDDPIERMPIITSPLNDLPGVRHYYRYLLPLMPWAIERLAARKYDLIISSSHCVAKGVIRSSDSLHICYCHTPMRYAWDQGSTYDRNLGPAGWALKAVRGHLQGWDLCSVGRVDHFIANSRNVARRIQRTYGRPAEVIYPPVDTEFFTPGTGQREDFYLMVTALAPYKQVGLAVEAFAKLGRPLRIIGSGQLLRRLRRRAGLNIEFLGWQDDLTVREHYRRCRALVFPGEDDFGMVPVEAMACGTPVIACAAGGALETVIDAGGKSSSEPTGLLYEPGTVDGLVSAVRSFEEIEDRFESEHSVVRARRFSKSIFLDGFKKTVAALLAERGLGIPW